MPLPKSLESEPLSLFSTAFNDDNGAMNELIQLLQDSCEPIPNVELEFDMDDDENREYENCNGEKQQI